jgi:hypothetical protein
MVSFLSKCSLQIAYLLPDIISSSLTRSKGPLHSLKVFHRLIVLPSHEDTRSVYTSSWQVVLAVFIISITKQSIFCEQTY